MTEPTNPVNLYMTPKLRAPHLVAAWSGMGAVALLAANYLQQALEVEFFGEIDPHSYYSPAQVIIQDGVIQLPAFPETRLYYWDKGQDHDLIMLIGTEQPPDAYGIAVQIVDTARQLGIERVYTAAAMPRFIPHTKDPAVWGTATHPELLAELEQYGVKLMDQGTIAGLNGLLLAVAKEHGIEGLCLLGEIPMYARGMLNPRASRAVLAVLTQMLGVEIDLDRLTLWADDLDSEMAKLYAALPEYIREAISRDKELALDPDLEATETEPPLIVDDAFFGQIEEFLKQQRKGEDDTEEQGSDQSPSPS
jgi:proteasome assembly chaperone (PAC2) family protein